MFKAKYACLHFVPDLTTLGMPQNPPASLKALIYIIVAVFVFIGGMYAVHRQLPPYQWIANANEAYLALEKKEQIIKSSRVEKTDETADPEIPVHKPGAYEGYTLYSSCGRAGAKLIDMDGKVVHQWYAPFKVVWPRAPQVPKPLPDTRIGWRDVYLYPNGDVLAVYEGAYDSPFGYGLAKLDKNSNLLWKLDENYHHAVTVGEDGAIYTLVQKIADTPTIPGITFNSPMIYQDAVVILTPDGKKIDSIDLNRALANSDYKHILAQSAKRSKQKGDILHTNYLLPLSKDLAPKFPMFKEGQILISLKKPNFIGVLDVPSRKFVWGTTGIWRGQHHAMFMPDGKIMIFDNNGEKEYSRIIKLDPASGKAAVEYPRNLQNDAPFVSKIRGMYQQLPNGNLLITSGQQFIAMEVDKSNQLVWKMNTRKSKDSTLCTAQRYSYDALPFLNEAK